jgi:hypothetical protein
VFILVALAALAAVVLVAAHKMAVLELTAL